MPLTDRPYGVPSQGNTVSGQTAIGVQASTVGPQLPATQLVTSATEIVVTQGTQSSGLPLQTVLPGDKNLEQKGFDAYWSGYIKTTATGTVLLKVYSGTSATVGNDTQLATSGAITQNTATAPFEVHLHLIYDSVSGKLTGYFDFTINNTIVARTALSNVVPAILNGNNPVATFLLSITSSGATTGTPTTINVAATSCG
jgi:hypothetical protein